MNYHKKRFLLSAISIVVISACEQRPESQIELDRVGPSAARFQTILEAPPKEGTYVGEQSEDKTPENDPKPPSEPDVPLHNPALPQGGGPLYPPVATDDDLLRVPYSDLGPDIVPYARCGDGIKQPLEQCDLGNGGFKPNSGTYPDGNVGNQGGCNIICGLPFCGNGVTEKNEACDDGNNENGDGCSSRCQFERCGNSVLDCNEQCDYGSNNAANGCSGCCLYEVCGNEILDPKEECDDGNLINGDGCSDCCKRETT
jgi:cysteine-rich repeat protein